MKKTLSFLAFAISLSFISCDDESDVGLALQDNDDLLQTSLIDTLTLELSSVLFNETINTDNATVLLFGNYEEANTGKTNATTYFQLVPENNRGGEAIDGAVFDSAVFQIRHYYNALGNPSVYGDINASLDLQLNQLSEALVDKDYPSTTVIATETSNLIVSPTININPSVDSTITLTLDQTFGQELFEQIKDSNTFLDFFKGFALSAPNAKSVVGLSSSNSKIVLYFHNSNDASVAIATNLVLSDNTVRFNNITADFTGTELSEISQNGDSYLASSNVYLKNGVGLGLHVGIPSLNTIMTSLQGVSINKAELVFSMAENYSSYLSSSAEFVSVYQSSTSSNLPILESETPLSTILDNSTSPVVLADYITGTYTIPLTTHFQQMAIGKQDVNDLFIFPFGNTSLVNTTTLAGTTNSNEALRPRLKIYYTK